MQKNSYKSTGNVGFFDKENTSIKLSKLGNPLERLHKVINFEMFRVELEDNMLKQDRKSNAGTKPYDVVLMFKILLLKRYYNLSDEQMEYQIIDRQSFKEFLGLSSGARVPDSRTIWLFQNTLIEKGVEEKLFEQFKNYMETLGLLVSEGKIVDASFVEVPRQRNTKDENEQIKQGKGDDLWNDNKHKKRQKDIDARWTKKNKETFYGYKDHVKINAKSKLIETYEVTSAEVHDSQAIDALIDKTDENQTLHGDSAYTGKEIDKNLKDKQIQPEICEKGYKGKPLTDEQKSNNNIKSKIRCRVEHIFGFVTQNMNDFYIQSIGFARAKGIIGLINLTYNMFRYEQIVRLELLEIKNQQTITI